jgi:hypothetical protein
MGILRVIDRFPAAATPLPGPSPQGGREFAAPALHFLALA